MSQVPVSLHLDHGTDEGQLTSALSQGFHSLMVDGSALPLEANSALTRRVVAAAHAAGVLVEAELGRIAGEEDGVTVADLEARMTSPAQVRAGSNPTHSIKLHPLAQPCALLRLALPFELIFLASGLCMLLVFLMISGSKRVRVAL